MTDAIGGAVLAGVVASPGLAVGPIALQRPAQSLQRVVGRPEEEEQALRAASEAAAAQLSALGEAARDEVAADILEFQLALLEDEDLIDPIFESVRAGEPADQAWTTALDREIAEYAASDDDTFRARAADLVDLRDRVVRALTPAADIRPVLGPRAAIYADEELTPSRFLEIDWSRYVGAATRGGSAAGHVALLARARGTPLVVGLQRFEALRDGTLAVLDAEKGHLILDPSPDTLADTRRRLSAVAARAQANAKFLAGPAVTAGGERVHVSINIDEPALLDRLDPAHCDGIGLTRTEFLFQGRELPDEEQQYRVYCRIIAWAAGRPVIVRTLDAGGDKPIAGLTVDGERNPFLGLRGLRLSLARPETFRVQLRALARAAATGDLKIMLPMVTEPRELEAARAMLEEVVAELRAAATEAALAPLGMMVEVPAAALTAASFAADFYSIGSNDLVQYVMAASRDNPDVARLYDPGNPAVHALIRKVVEVADARGVEVSLCGDMASDPAHLPTLLDLGLRKISVAPASLGPVKAAIASWP